MDKETTPQTYAAWKASIDDTGCICRMEPIWTTMERFEKQNAKLAGALHEAIYGGYKSRQKCTDILRDAILNNDKHIHPEQTPQDNE